MKTKHWIFWLLSLAGVLAGGVATAQDGLQRTMTLLPIQEKTDAISSKRDDAAPLWIQNSPVRDVFLQFDLSRLPPGLKESDFVRCTLRIVARELQYKPAGNPDSGGPLVLVKGQIANDDLTPVKDAREVVSLSTLSAADSKNNDVALSSGAGLLKAVTSEYSGDRKLTLRLHTISSKASSLFFSSHDTGSPRNPSNIPRLVIEYKPEPPGLLQSAGWTQHQQNPEHTGRSPWIPFRAPTTFRLAGIPLPEVEGNTGSIADYPLIYRGNLYLVGKFEEQNVLFCLDFRGTERWRSFIGRGTVQRSPVISGDGIFYVVTEDRIAAYDLDQMGKHLHEYELGEDRKLAPFTDLTLGHDGSLFLALAEKDSNYIHGLTPSLKPFLRAGPFGAGREKISTITVSPDGRRIFAQIPAGAVAIDVANPSDQRTVPLGDQKERPWEYYHVPLAGPAGSVMVFSDFSGSDNRGNIWGYTTDRRLWSAAGTLLPQPVLGSNGCVYVIQDNCLQGHRYDRMGGVDVTSCEDKLRTTSNLVADGGDHLYFWDNGYLHGYGSDGKRLFERILLSAGVKERSDESTEGPEQFLRLMMGPDGTLWANNKNGDALFAFKPGYAENDVTLRQEDIKPRTVYRAEGTLSVGGVTLEAGSLSIFQARDGIGFARGFTVRSGASLAARTGF